MNFAAFWKATIAITLAKSALGKVSDILRSEPFCTLFPKDGGDPARATSLPPSATYTFFSYKQLLHKHAQAKIINILSIL